MALSGILKRKTAGSAVFVELQPGLKSIMSQKALGAVLDKEDQTIANWEKHDKVPREADLILRNLYMESIGENPLVSKLIERLNTIDREIQKMERVCFQEVDNGWVEAA